jgi:HEAT repeat protein
MITARDRALMCPCAGLRVEGLSAHLRWIVLGLAFVAAACGGGEESEPAATVDAVAALEAFDGAQQARQRSFSRLNAALAAEPAATREAALSRLETDDRDLRLAAVYALGLSLEARDADRLAPFLESGLEAERVLAATALLSVGDGRAVPVLIEALESEELLPLANPTRVREQARFALGSFTGESFGLDRAAWGAWWDQVESSFSVVRAPDRFAP